MEFLEGVVMGDSDRGVALDYDEVLEYIGQFGKYQRKIFFWLWLVSAAGGLAVVVFGFTAYVPKYRVRTECDGPDSTYYMDTTSWTLPAWLNDEEVTDEALKLTAQDCRIPTVIKDIDGNCIGSYFTNQSASIMSGDMQQLIIDREVRSTSLVEQYSFVCDRSYIRPYYSAIYMLGMLFGSYIFGFLSDTYGRKKAMMLAIVMVSLSGSIGTFCVGPGAEHGFAFLRFLTGMGGIGCFMVCFVLAVEHVGYKFTMLIGIAIEIPFALGEALLGIEALVVRDWQILQSVAYLPLLALLGLYWVVPESTRWLIGRNKVAEAHENIRNAAECNGRKVPDFIFQETMKPEEMEQHLHGKRASILDLVKTKTMLLRTANMGFQWFSVTMCYYGLTNASTGLSGDAYTNFMLSCLIEIPGYLFCMFLMDVWGRRPVLSFCQIVSGLSCIIVGLLTGIPSVVGLQIFLSLIGKFGASASFGIVYVYTAEMFPTTIRNQAVGICSLIARIGGICALLLDLLKTLSPNAPVLIMGCIATIAGLLALLFPETLGQKLPETMEEALRVGENSARGICTFTCISPRELYREELREVEEDKEKS